MKLLSKIVGYSRAIRRAGAAFLLISVAVRLLVEAPFNHKLDWNVPLFSTGAGIFLVGLYASRLGHLRKEKSPTEGA